MFQETLLEGERRLGRYTVEVARRTTVGSGWSTTIPPLDAIVTNYRLILHPQGRRQHRPASIPGHYIAQVEALQMGMRRGVALTVRGGPLIHLMVGIGQKDDFFDDLVTLKAPRPRFHFDDQVTRAEIERLVEFLNKM